MSVTDLRNSVDGMFFCRCESKTVSGTEVRGCLISWAFGAN